jgi:hypothetical protein
MSAVRGHYNGRVVVLDEPAPVAGEVDVIVHFPDRARKPGRLDKEALLKHLEESRRILSGVGSVSEELRRQRDME